MLGSSTIGKSTATPKRSRITLIQARWENRLSTDSASNPQFSASNCGFALLMATNSLVQTGVKSPGWENSTSHRPRHCASDTTPSVLRAAKLGTTSPSRNGAQARGAGCSVMASTFPMSLPCIRWNRP